MKSDLCAPKAFYRPRQPQKSPLYQRLDQHFEEFKSTYEERFERNYGPYRFAWDEVVPKYIDCGIFENGFARIQCPSCKKERFLPFSCKSQLCPACEQKRRLLFAEKIVDEVLLPVPHRFWTFSIPKAIRGIMRKDRRLLKLLPRCAFEAVKWAMQEALPQGAEKNKVPGAVMALHTTGSLLQWNPHVHGLISEGVMDQEGRFHPIPNLQASQVESLFQPLLLDALLEKKRISPALVASLIEVPPGPDSA